MKLLIVEDEALTRDSLVQVISRSPLKDRYDELLTACDGSEGLEMALAHRPEIILTDVRMPSLRGDQMAMEIRKRLPNVCIIFMSGYSDKEYLLSAVKVNADNYLEKPLDIAELLATLEAATTRQQRRARETQYTTQNQRRLSMSLPALKRLLAQQLTCDSEDGELRREQLWSVCPRFLEDGWFSTVELLLLSPPGRDEAADAEALCPVLEAAVARCTDALVGRLEGGLLVAQLCCGQGEREQAQTALVKWCCWLRDTLGGDYRFVLFVGKLVDAAEKLPQSHQSLQAQVKRAFFCKPGSVAYAWVHPAADSAPGGTLGEMTDDIVLALKQYDRNSVDNGLYRMERFLAGGQSATEPEARRAYGKIAAALRAENERIRGDAAGDIEAELLALPSLVHLQERVGRELARYFQNWSDVGNLPVFAMRLDKYLEENYASSQLSLHELALRFSASESYLCVLYRKAFDTTINRRITALRMGQAQRLLLGTDRLIKEIAADVGYLDCNSFIRLFKKQTGLTPQEYRERGGD